ncbi:hypothetical protein BH09SUM1_BH09SUM1_32310 [soil metagenome]
MFASCPPRRFSHVRGVTKLPTGIKSSPVAALRDGVRAILAAPPLVKSIVAILFLLTLLMLPFGRTGAGDAGGLLAPLTSDSSRFRPKGGAGLPATDFYTVYDAGARLLALHDPYGVNLDAGGAGFRAPSVSIYRYPPITTFWLAAPLNVLPPYAAYVAWTLLCVAMLAGNFLLCAGMRPPLIPAFALIWFGWFPTIAELHMGQFTLLMATLMLWGVEWLWRGDGRGGVAWALAVMLKVYPIAMAPSLFLWGRRRLAIATVAILLGSTLLWKVALPSQDSGAIDFNLRGGRIVGGMRQPYAGAQGVQELVTMIGWKLGGKSFAEGFAPPSSYRLLTDPVFIANGVLLAAFGAICLWALIVTRGAPNLPAIGLFWLSWFYAYRDCWEHHYMLVQALIALLAMRGVIGWRVMIFCWVFAGAPSFWWLWQRAGMAGSPIAESLGVLYFLQRPVAVFFLTGLLVQRIRKPTA